ncbi:hypothetical protein [Flavobacterium sp. KACC 22763]|uniref:hypothetical protein n=1 Tax=Flavobacterium sp. KACC 22763 TaxID=3025668 RepID=UPI002367344F|nr:hypothetical protein [Flavobacterium sp. KACC 22763]WDF65656.1 hypothetical protein PQ463_05685 [Flavobacterium sp. KACC 22763]
MNKLKGVISVIGIIVKYSAVVMAIIKGVQVVYDELQKLDLSGDKNDTKQLKEESDA